MLVKYGCPNRSWTVSLHVTDKHIRCSCLGFESDIIPCRHAFAVMKAVILEKIPDTPVLERWRRDVKEKPSCVSVGGLEETNSVKIARFGIITYLCNKL